MPANFLAWSHSRWKTFKSCPRQLWHQIAPKTHPDHVPYEQNKFQKAGEEIDSALTARISKGVPLPEKYADYEGMAALAATAPGNRFTQMQLALDQSFEPCGSRDWDRAWVRANYDYALINGSHAFVWDWKNGKPSVDESQLQLYAAVGFHTFPEVEVIDTSYVWLQHGTTSPRTYRRRELSDLWHTFLPTVEQMQVSFSNSHWPATPERQAFGASVCKWCVANKAGKCPVAAVKYGGR
jgi:hypothetical protein